MLLLMQLLFMTMRYKFIIVIYTFPLITGYKKETSMEVSLGQSIVSKLSQFFHRFQSLYLCSDKIKFILTPAKCETHTGTHTKGLFVGVSCAHIVKHYRELSC